MNKIVDDYLINENTVAIVPAYNIEYESIVTETDKTYYVKKHPFKLIQENCLQNGASYDGRRHSIVYLTGFSRCVPIPINPRKDIFAFPTHSPKNDDCSWIFFKHILTVQRGENRNESVIYFKNGQKLTLNISYHTLSTQHIRLFVCRQALLRSNQFGTDPLF